MKTHSVVSNVHIHKMNLSGHERERRERKEGAGGEKGRKKKRKKVHNNKLSWDKASLLLCDEMADLGNRYFPHYGR